MSTPPQRPSPSLIPAEVAHWLEAATRKRLQLHMQATEPLAFARAEAFRQMAALLEEALEKVRVLSAALREESQAVREHATALQEGLAALHQRVHPPEP